MIRFELFFGVLVFALCIYCLVDVIGRSDGEIRNLPKLWWIVLVLLFPLVGSIAYLAVGRPQGTAGRSPHERAVPLFPEYDRPGRAAATKPEDDEEFLRKVRERAEEQRRAYREAQREKQRLEELERQRRQRNPDTEPDEA
jgi:hypothetical protein